ncbi:MAG: glutamine--fructose-6-phosphate aminotransferase, partial [Candidatus Thiodiazotropha taylori]
MCGIVGGIAHRDVVPVLMEGLKRLEYRGYDSAGVAVLDENQHLQRIRSVGKVSRLKGLIDQAELSSKLGSA